MKNKHVLMKALIFATVILVAVLQPALANPVTPENPSRASVIYLGSNDSQYSIQLAFENADRDMYYITLKDEDGNVVYSEKTSAPAYRKKFHFETDVISGGEITINIFTRKSGINQKFVINKKVTTREEVVVTEVNK